MEDAAEVHSIGIAIANWHQNRLSSEQAGARVTTWYIVDGPDQTGKAGPKTAILVQVPLYLMMRLERGCDGILMPSIFQNRSLSWDFNGLSHSVVT